MTQVQTLPVIADDEDIRLDRWFKRHFPELGHGRLEKMLRTGQIRVDGKRAKSSTRLIVGQNIRVPPMGAAPATNGKPKIRPQIDERETAWLQDAILHMDDQVIAINKPPGLAVQGGSGIKRHLDGMLDALRFGLPDRPRLVHRLDKDTSGVLLLGRSPGSASKLAEIFRTKEAKKTYWAITVGLPRPANGRVDLAIGKGASASSPDERMLVDGPGAKRAVTYYSVVEEASKRAAWIALRPITGRTHQLRVHCAAMGTPILGDGKYGGADAFINGVPGGKSLMLHARGIEIKLPNRSTLHVTAPLPDSMKTVWRFFEFDPEINIDPFAKLEV
jgi:23S rRNA pseudouridine955/2504/2580 synthase